MSHFARVVNGLVTEVIVADQDFIDSGHAGDPAEWIRTCNHTHGGQHDSGGIALRKNYAAVGDTYDVTRDAFISPPAFPSWVLNEQTCQYQAPIPLPEDGKLYQWDEAQGNWREIQPLT